jgi:8-oxo-dGTP pyrophosphatase MutT (NUDIX family)
MHTETFLAALAAHAPADEREANHRITMMQYVSSHRDNWWRRATQEGHVTGSAWILNRARTHALLLHHAKLNIWVQPGGHLDDTDASPASGALREAREETGFAELALPNAALFDVDIHVIPARASKMSAEPAHFHFDARYLMLANHDRAIISAESLALKWVSLGELSHPSQERSIARMAEKSLRLKL